MNMAMVALIHPAVRRPTRRSTWPVVTATHKALLTRLLPPPPAPSRLPPPPPATTGSSKTATVGELAIAIPSQPSGFMFSVTGSTKLPLIQKSTDSKVQELNPLGPRYAYPNAVRATIASKDVTDWRLIAPSPREASITPIGTWDAMCIRRANT